MYGKCFFWNVASQQSAANSFNYCVQFFFQIFTVGTRRQIELTASQMESADEVQHKVGIQPVQPECFFPFIRLPFNGLLRRQSLVPWWREQWREQRHTGYMPAWSLKPAQLKGQLVFQWAAWRRPQRGAELETTRRKWKTCGGADKQG